MERKLSVLVVEDERDICNALVQAADETDDISIVSITNNSVKAIEYVKKYLPEAIILDLELHEGYGNGLSFLKELKALDLPVEPYVLITTNNSSTVTYEYARNLGAGFIMAKHQSDYSEKAVIEFLSMMKDVILNRAYNTSSSLATTESPEQTEKRINRLISLELDNIGINPKSVGYKYLIDAVKATIEEPQTNLCRIIGEKYGKSDSSVERAMQNAINRAWRTSDIDDLERYYTARIRSERGVPTITEFICYYANKIRNEY